MPFVFFDSSENTVSPSPTVASPGSYVRYSGSVTSIDDGYTSTPISLPSGMNWQYGTIGSNTQATFTQFYVSTNGYISFGNGSGSIYNSPQIGTIAGNPGDLWLQSGLANTVNTTTVHDIFTLGRSFTYTKRGVNDPNGAHYVMDIVVYCGTYGATTTAKDYYIRLLKYAGTQWVQIRATSAGTAGSQGVYGTISGVSQVASSQLNKVWESSNGGQSWTYRGTGCVAAVGPTFTAGAYDSSGGISISKIIDNLEFQVGSQTTLVSTGYPWWNYYNRAGAEGSEALLGASFMNIGAIASTILGYVVGSTTAQETAWLLDTTYGGYAGDINGNGSLPDLSDAIRLGNIQAGAIGCQALTDAPIIKLINLMRLGISPTYSEALRTAGIIGGISLNNVRPGYAVYDTGSTRVVSNVQNTGYTGGELKTRLYSQYVNTGINNSLNTQISMNDHVGKAISVRGVGGTIRGTGGNLP